MIPKTIHYCWFGGNPLPKLAKKCIKSWEKHCKGYEIREWNEHTFDIASAPLYVRQAYEAKKWAFVTDYVRLQVVHEHGGIYLDTDVELKKRLDSLLGYEAFFGFEDGIHVNTGLGFGAVAGQPVVKAIMDDYDGIPFIKEDGSGDQETCPRRNTRVLLRYGLKQDDSKQILDENVLILPSVYLCPLSYETGKRRYSKDTVSIHWFGASWQTKEQRNKHKENRKRIRRTEITDYVTHIPNRMIRGLLGEIRYEKLKRRIKRR